MDLLQYFNHRIEKPTKRKLNICPFITISRESGCDASRLARMLISNFVNIGQTWKYIDKEILHESSKKLSLKDSQIDYVFNAEKKKHADEIMSALSNRYYKSDSSVRKGIEDVVKQIAGEGNVILVGRGGAAITSQLKKGLHIKLVAPREWRIQNLMKRKGKTRKEVENYINDSDDKRRIILKEFKKNKDQEIVFDLTLNCAKFNQKEQVDLIFKSMELKYLEKNLISHQEKTQAYHNQDW